MYKNDSDIIVLYWYIKFLYTIKIWKNTAIYAKMRFISDIEYRLLPERYGSLFAESVVCNQKNENTTNIDEPGNLKKKEND